jgi:hypothetical protein
VIVVRDLQSTSQISNLSIRDFVRQRIEDLGGGAFNADALGYFLVIEAGDNIQAIHGQVGFNILHNRFTGARYDQPGFTPSFEFVEEFPVCYDMVFVLDDSGYGVEMFVPKEVDIDVDLIAMCRMHAYLAPPENAP